MLLPSVVSSRTLGHAFLQTNSTHASLPPPPFSLPLSSLRLGVHGLRLVLIVLLLGRLRLSAETLHLPCRDHAPQQEGAEDEQPKVNPECGVVPVSIRFVLVRRARGGEGKGAGTNSTSSEKKKRRRASEEGMDGGSQATRCHVG